MTIGLIIGATPEETKRREKQIHQWREALNAQLAPGELQVWPNIDQSTIEYLILWNHPIGMLKQCPRLKAVTSLGAGVNHILADESLPRDLPVARVTDTVLSRDMTHYVIQAVLNQSRMLDRFREGQTRKEWRQTPPFTLNDELTVGIMGLGEIGQHIARALQSINIPVIGWSRRLKTLESMPCFDEAGLDEFLANSHILVCILPLTPATEGILNLELMQKLPKGAYIINIARGQHLVEADLITACDNDQLSGAKLDVFHTEPLPQDHPFWTHPKIEITPHNAGVSLPANVAPFLLENYRRVQRGETLLNQVEITQGY
ncbi:MAG: glyoxylate/hydroxypyruvate reductase A [Gammaproteobacteria bacterium CG11_big_fil_rev_8_21_14_0_20_46_22]|nr:MAG: glyoxylate/hydroxypyruvate reductase A [Gammaproteobacteria bacterium CG12_big_fil_rev_8_21_14_0_65_46_12]PIR10921.1 MAG: glyoxylate/hydroxypyruvate reductase A [Gammaproteobacteria bacterium CG11_big_fil_rev_8_21_14_0_20_46_22]